MLFFVVFNFPGSHPLTHLQLVTARNSSCGKVMFSRACVKNFVHRGGGISQHALGRGGVYPGVYVCPGGVFPGVCPLGVVYPPGTKGRHPPQPEADHHPPGIEADPPPGPQADTPHAGSHEIRSTSGLYASYRNAFLFVLF